MKELEDLLQHHGVKGMKWGVRRDPSSRKRQRAYNKGMRLIDRVRLRKMTSSEARKKYLDEKDKKWIENASDDKNIRKVTRQVNKEFTKVNKALKEQFGGKGVSGAIERAILPSTSIKYNKALKEAYDEILADKTFTVYKLSPTRTREVQLSPNSDGTIKATIVERNNPKLAKQRTAGLRHADSDEDDGSTLMDGMTFVLIPDDDGFPDRVISPFDDEEEDTIQQAGVKGMKWGVRRDYNRPGGADGKKDAKDKPIRTALGRKLNSLKRERQWRSVLKRMDELSNDDIRKVVKRIDLENSLKTLSKTYGNKKDKDDYLRRGRMDDEELTRKVARLRLKESLTKSVSSASKEQREFGEKILRISGTIGLRYALKKDLNLWETVKNPKGEFAKAKGDAQTALAQKGKDLLKEMMEKAR